jgi:hypothetical protein
LLRLQVASSCLMLEYFTVVAQTLARTTGEHA